jgi:hypothetical protein
VIGQFKMARTNGAECASRVFTESPTGVSMNDTRRGQDGGMRRAGTDQA